MGLGLVKESGFLDEARLFFYFLGADGILEDGPIPQASVRALPAGSGRLKIL